MIVMSLFADLLKRRDVLGLTKTAKELLVLKCPKFLYPVYDKDTLVGLEIEVEAVPFLPETDPIWLTKADNSLRNGGIEYVSPPICGDEISRMLSSFYTTLSPEAVFSTRTSIHVHINCLNLTTDQITRFVLLYLVLEKVLYRFVGRDRERNVFCVPLQDTWRVGDLFADLQKKLHRPHDYQLADENIRYMGINFASLYEFGTLEFRQLHGTRNEEKVVTWINLLLAIKNYASNVTTKELLEKIFALNTTSQYRGFAQDIFGIIFSKLNLMRLDQDIEKGVCAIKYSILADTFKQRLKREISALSPAIKWLIKEMQCVV